MKNRNTQITAVLFALAFGLAPIVQAAPRPDGGPTRAPANEAPRLDGGPTRLAADESTAYAASSEDVQLPIVTINSTGNVTRGKIGSFVLEMKPALGFGGSYVNFSVSGTAVAGVDYVVLVSPAYVGSSGYGVIQVQTLPDPRGSSSRRAYSVVIKLEPGAGYALGVPSSATMWIMP